MPDENPLFASYTLMQVYKIGGIYIMRNYPNNLIKAHHFGTEKVRYENCFYDCERKRLFTNPAPKDDSDLADFIRKIEQFIAHPPATSGAEINMSYLLKLESHLAAVEDKNHPFAQYKLMQLYKIDGIYIMRNHQNNLIKAHHFGTEKVCYENCFYDCEARKLYTNSASEDDSDCADFIRKIRQVIARPSALSGTGNVLLLSSIFKPPGSNISRELQGQIKECIKTIYQEMPELIEDENSPTHSI